MVWHTSTMGQSISRFLLALLVKVFVHKIGARVFDAMVGESTPAVSIVVPEAIFELHTVRLCQMSSGEQGSCVVDGTLRKWRKSSTHRLSLDS